MTLIRYLKFNSYFVNAFIESLDDNVNFHISNANVHVPLMQLMSHL